MRARPSLPLTICLLAAAVAVLGLLRPGDRPPAADAVSDTAGDAVDIAGFAFSPLPARSGGTTIEVTNSDGAAHTLTARDGSFDTGLLSGGDRATFTAPLAPGTYEFFCELHPSMTGTLTVG
ncbi:MAG: cupredoxin domain-containing protein [Acidimicrobiales bacterium]|nr:cupredoxin domain-containing protein [Acidimicrobiales bacterium]